MQSASYTVEVHHGACHEEQQLEDLHWPLIPLHQPAGGEEGGPQRCQGNGKPTSLIWCWKPARASSLTQWITGIATDLALGMVQRRINTMVTGRALLSSLWRTYDVTPPTPQHNCRDNIVQPNPFDYILAPPPQPAQDQDDANSFLLLNLRRALWRISPLQTPPIPTIIWSSILSPGWRRCCPSTGWLLVQSDSHLLLRSKGRLNHSLNLSYEALDGSNSAGSYLFPGRAWDVLRDDVDLSTVDIVLSNQC